MAREADKEQVVRGVLWKFYDGKRHRRDRRCTLQSCRETISRGTGWWTDGCGQVICDKHVAAGEVPPSSQYAVRPQEGAKS